MDEIRVLNDAEKMHYRFHIHSDRLKTLSRVCPDDGELIDATGEMYLRKNTDRWSVEYRCPRDGEIIRSWQPDVDALTKQIAADVLGKEGID